MPRAAPAEQARDSGGMGVLVGMAGLPATRPPRPFAGHAAANGRGPGAPGSGVELGQFGLDHRLVFLLVPARVARPPPAAQNRDAEQEDDYPGEADPVPGLPLAGSFRRGVLHV